MSGLKKLTKKELKALKATDSQVITYIDEAKIIALPSYVCASTTRLTMDGAHALWDLIHDEQMKVFLYDPLMELRYKNAEKYAKWHQITPFSLITCEYMVFVEVSEIIQCRFLNDCSFKVIRSKRVGSNVDNDVVEL